MDIVTICLKGHLAHNDLECILLPRTRVNRLQCLGEVMGVDFYHRQVPCGPRRWRPPLPQPPVCECEWASLLSRGLPGY